VTFLGKSSGLIKLERIKTKQAVVVVKALREFFYRWGLCIKGLCIFVSHDLRDRSWRMQFIFVDVANFDK